MSLQPCVAVFLGRLGKGFMVIPVGVESCFMDTVQMDAVSSPGT